MKKTDVIYVTTHGAGMEEALAVSEQAGIESGLERKQLLRLRLLSEELFGMVKSITGDVEAVYWIEFEKKEFSIHLKAEVGLTQEMYSELIETSTRGKNIAAKGFMGRLKNVVTYMLLPQSTFYQDSIGIMSLGFPGYHTHAEAYLWSMSQYKIGLMDQKTRKEIMEENMDENLEENLMEAKDELEKSIIANIADEITVGIENSTVEITIMKAF